MKLVLRVVMESLSFLRYRREMGEARLCWGLGKAPRLPRAGSVTRDLVAPSRTNENVENSEVCCYHDLDRVGDEVRALRRVGYFRVFQQSERLPIESYAQAIGITSRQLDSLEVRTVEDRYVFLDI